MGVESALDPADLLHTRVVATALFQEVSDLGGNVGEKGLRDVPCLESDDSTYLLSVEVVTEVSL